MTLDGKLPISIVESQLLTPWNDGGNFVPMTQREPRARTIVHDDRIPGVEVEVPLDGGWRVYGRFALIEGRLALTELRLLPGRERSVPPWVDDYAMDLGQWDDARDGPGLPPGQQITRRLLASVKLRPLEEAARDEALDAAQGADPEFLSNELKHLGDVGGGIAARPRTAEHSARIARLYVELRRSNPRKPTAALAEYLGVSTSIARDEVRRARERGMLEHVGQGRAGGRLTARAIRVLREADAAANRDHMTREA